ncbi:MAG: cobalamin-binding protein [Desulfobacterales bacterium]|nr:cobalamin-binding protein [Desulfobacterales bacterium]
MNKEYPGLIDFSPGFLLQPVLEKLQVKIGAIKSAISSACCLVIFSLVAGGLFPPTAFAATYTVVTDLLGRSVKVPADPRRVIALAPNITEIIFALKQEHRLKGVTQFSDYPVEARKLPKVGSYVQLDLERIVALKPDLCIAIKDGNPRSVVERLESMGIAVYALDPRNLNSVMETILAIGRLMQAENTARDLVQTMQARVARVQTNVSKAAGRPGVFFQIGISPIVSVGTPTFIHELIEKAGGRNLAAGDTPYPRFSREQVLGLSPDVIIITSMARTDIFERVKEEWSRWPNMPAVQNRKIFITDSNLFDRPSPRLVDALELLAGLIHPDLIRENQSP